MADEQLKETLRQVSSEVYEHMVAGAEEGVAAALEQVPDEVEAAYLQSHGQHEDTCVVCGNHVNPAHAKRTAGGGLVCKECREKLSDIVTTAMLAKMSPAQVRQHVAQVRRLQELYENDFTPTKTFCSGKKLDHPTLAVDETHGWWAIPDSKRPLVFSLDGIVDYRMVVKSSRYFGELESAISINRLVDTLRGILRRILLFFRGKRYMTPYPDLPSIPEGEEPTEMKVVLTLDGDASGLGEVPVNVCGSRVTAPSNVDGAYECAHQIIEYLLERRNQAFRRHVPSSDWGVAEEVAWLREVVEQADATMDDREYLRYYLTRLSVDLPVLPMSTFANKLTAIKTILAWVANNLCEGHDGPKLETQQTISLNAFVGASTRYAPDVRFSDIVYLHDATNMLSGKGGFLIAVDAFATDTVRLGNEKDRPVMPVRYDDLLCVLRDGGKGLVLVYRDGRKVTLALDGYAHYLFVAINCILFMRASQA